MFSTWPMPDAIGGEGGDHRAAAGSYPDLFVGVNRQSDPRNLSDLERRHIPAIEAPEVARKGEYFQVKIEIGKTLPHPNERDHYIEFVDLYADEAYLARVSFAAVTSAPRASLWIALANEDIVELRAFARCNLHGVWLGSKPITVQG